MPFLRTPSAPRRSRRPFRPSTEFIERRALLSASPTDVLTYHNDNGRTGQALNETILTPANVNAATFGKLFTDPVDGYVYAQPLTMANVTVPGQGARNLVFVATEHDSVYAFDADKGGAPIWHDSFINPAAGVTTVPTLKDYQLDLYPEVGITSTPVIDPATNTLYVVAETKETSGGATNEVLRLHALDVATGTEKSAAVIATSVQGTGVGHNRKGLVPFQAEFQIQRPGLLLSGGVVYTAYGSLGDFGPYHGWIIGNDARTLQTVAKFNSTPNGNEAGIWMSGGGLAADEGGNVFALTGNGTFTAPNGGKDYGDSILKLDRNLRVRDYFTPPNQKQLAAKDLDLGSGGALLVPVQPGPRPHVFVGGGKDGTLFVLNRDKLGHYRPKRGVAGQSIPNPGHSVFSTPAYFNGTVYVHAVGDVLKAYGVVNGTLVGPVSQGTTSFGYPGATPSVSANGATNGIVWEIQNTGKRGVAGVTVLHALNASSVSQELYNSTQAGDRDLAGPYVKFAVPTISNGKVYVATQTGLAVYGLLA
jgi:hypothetical protein